MKTAILLSYIVFCLGCSQSYGQDFIRVGVGGDFNRDKFIQTFSLDLNRTENVREKAGRYLLYNKNGVYLTPSSDVNLGEGITSSENNILVQLYFGKAFFDKDTVESSQFTVTRFNKALEINPVINADKNFDQVLYFGQLKYLLNFTKASYNPLDNSLASVFSFSTGPFLNIGHRRTKLDSSIEEDNIDGSTYSVSGVLAEVKSRFRKNAGSDGIVDNWIWRLGGNYYYVIKDNYNLTGDDYAGIIKLSLDKRISNRIFLGIAYKYGNDNPNYVNVHTLETGIKVTY